MAAMKNDEAVGTSENFSFEEALNNAINALPPRSADIEFVTVMEIKAEVGGFVGARRIHVRVKREPL